MCFVFEYFNTFILKFDIRSSLRPISEPQNAGTLIEVILILSAFKTCQQNDFKGLNKGFYPQTSGLIQTFIVTYNSCKTNHSCRRNITIKT